MAEIEAARAGLRDIVLRLEHIDKRLKEIASGLSLEGDPVMQDVITEIRSVVECVLLDSIGPATRDLRAAAHYKGKPDKEDGI